MLKISTRGRYALRVMIYLAERNSDDFIPLREIAHDLGISEKYLESIISHLSKKHFLVGARGKGGGYRLTRSPSTYTAGSIIKATEGNIAPVSCLEDENQHCDRAEDCRTLPLWTELYRIIDDYLEGVTLEDLRAHADPGDNYII